MNIILFFGIFFFFYFFFFFGQINEQAKCGWHFANKMNDNDKIICIIVMACFCLFF